MNDDTPANERITVLYDPLCGWCYGATPALRRLAAQPGLSVEVLPTGLFAGANARAMDARFAEYAWANDQRIAQLTGQPFSQTYRDRVLGNRKATLDSGPALMALTAVAQTSPGEELRTLEAIQAARYVEGKDVTSASVLGDLLRELGLVAAAAELARPSAELETAIARRTAAGRALLHAVGARGVPTVVAGDAATRRLVPSDLLYGRFDQLMHHVWSTGSSSQTMHGGR